MPGHDLFVLRLRHLVLGNQKRAQLHRVNRAFVGTVTRLGIRAAHLELAAWQEHKTDAARVVGVFG